MNDAEHVVLLDDDGRRVGTAPRRLCKRRCRLRDYGSIAPTTIARTM